MDRNLNRIIAREGLILVLLAVLSSVIFFSSNIIYKKCEKRFWSLVDSRQKLSSGEPVKVVNGKELDFIAIYKDMKQTSTIQNNVESLGKLAFPLAIICYILYLIIRFIPWAIKTLKEKK